MRQKEVKASQGMYNKETEYVLDFTKYYYNLLQREQDGVVQSYVWDDELIFMEENGEGYRYLNDIQGSAMQLLDSTKTSKVHYSYDEFGRDLSNNQGNFQPFGYTGYLKDNMSGLYYAQAREYNAQSGRFISEDIVEGNTVSPMTLNAYGYCSNNPLIHVDYDGRQKTFILGEECEYIENDSNMNSLLWERTQKILIASGDYECVGYDENGTPLIRKKQKHYIKALVKDGQNESMDVTDVESIDKAYDATSDGLSIVNETTNSIETKSIKKQPRPNNIGKGTWNKQVTKKLAEQAKFYSKFDDFLKKLGPIGLALDVGVGIYNNVEAGTSWKRTASDAFVDLTICLFIIEVSMWFAEGTGAVVGAIVGFFLGGAYGAAAGAALGTTLSLAILTIIYSYALDYFLNNRQYDGLGGKTFKEYLKESFWQEINNLVAGWQELGDCID